MLTVLLTLSVAHADESPKNDITIDLGVATGCIGLCLDYDRQVREKLDLGFTITPLLIFDALSLYAQVDVKDTGQNLFFVEPSFGVFWSPLSRELYFGGGLGLGLERSLQKGRFFHAQLGGGVMYDYGDILPWPDVRVGLGKRF